MQHSLIPMIADLVVLPDTDLLAAGSDLSGSMAACQLSSSGEVLATYGGSGTALVSNGDSCSASALATEVDGSAVLAGRCGGNNSDMAVARLTPDGQADLSFGGSGIVTVDFGRDSSAADVALLPGGQILLAGRALQGGNSEGVALARLDIDGSLDPGFGVAGLVSEGLGANDAYAAAVEVQPDGKIVVAGSIDLGSGFDILLARFEADGSFDPSFGSGGFVAVELGPDADYASALALQADGSIVVAGSSTVSTRQLMVARFTDSGERDPGFASDGVYLLTDPIGSGAATGVAIGADGVVYAYGVAGLSLVLVQLDASGAPLAWACSP